MWFRKIVCKIVGHKPITLVKVKFGTTPKGEPTIEEFEMWTGKPSGVIGIAESGSYIQCERCGQKLKRNSC